MNKYLDLLEEYDIDSLLVCSTNQYLVEYSSLNENSRYALTGFSGSTGDALITKDKIYLFVDGRYHIQAENEVFDNIAVIKLQLGQKQDEEIKKLLKQNETLGIVAKKISQARLENFKDFKIKLLDDDPINTFEEEHSKDYSIAFEEKNIKFDKPTYISNLEEISYITGLRDFSKDFSAKIWASLFIENNNKLLFSDKKSCYEFLKNYEDEISVDKNSINAYEYNLIRKPVHTPSKIKKMMSIKTNEEIKAYKEAFSATDLTMTAIRNFIQENEDLSEYDIATQLKKEFLNYGAKSLSFKSIVAIDNNSALAHYSKNSKDVILKNGSLVLIDCGAYYKSGLATDITRVFVKGDPSSLQKKVYTQVLKAFLNSYNSNLKTGFEIDSLAHSILDNKIDGFIFNHGLGHGIGINVHEAPPNLSQNEIAKTELKDGMTFTIEPGLYNQNYFGIRLENSCYKENNKIHSFTNFGYEKKLIDFDLLNLIEKEWLKDFKLL